MAGIDSGGGTAARRVSTKRSLDPVHRPSLLRHVPSGLGRMEPVRAPRGEPAVPGQSGSDEQPDELPQCSSADSADGFVLGSAGDSENIDKAGDDYDFVELRKRLQHQKLNVHPTKTTSSSPPRTACSTRASWPPWTWPRALSDDAGRPIRRQQERAAALPNVSFRRGDSSVTARFVIMVRSSLE